MDKSLEGYVLFLYLCTRETGKRVYEDRIKRVLQDLWNNGQEETYSIENGRIACRSQGFPAGHIL